MLSIPLNIIISNLLCLYVAVLEDVVHSMEINVNENTEVFTAVAELKQVCMYSVIYLLKGSSFDF